MEKKYVLYCGAEECGMSQGITHGRQVLYGTATFPALPRTTRLPTRHCQY